MYLDLCCCLAPQFAVFLSWCRQICTSKNKIILVRYRVSYTQVTLNSDFSTFNMYSCMYGGFKDHPNLIILERGIYTKLNVLYEISLEITWL